MNVEIKCRYPYIGISVQGNVVLFTGVNTGVYLAGGYHDVGNHAKNWDENSFEFLKEPLILCNEGVGEEMEKGGK